MTFENPKPKIMRPNYIGDGAYVGLTSSGDLVIWAPRSDGDHWVVVDHAMFKRLILYRNENLPPLQV